MTERENLLSLLRRQGFSHIPVDFSLCPSLEKEYAERTGSAECYRDYFRIPWRMVGYSDFLKTEPDRYRRHYDMDKLHPGTVIDEWGVAHEPGSDAAMHMTRMHSPLRNAGSVGELEQYPWPAFREDLSFRIREKVEELQARDLVVNGFIGSPVWECSWSIRGMEPLMMDMMSDDPMAEFLLDKVTEISVQAARAFAESGADILHMGDDIGMQRGIMMSVDLFCAWLLPRIEKVIRAARAIKPDILVFFHSCGYIKPFIPLLIRAGVDILNPIQPECMDFGDVYRDFGGGLSFHGTIGTQSTMPFGTPEDVRREVFRNLKITGDKGGLFAAPTHLLEPEVPWENIVAYAEACRDFTR